MISDFGGARFMYDGILIRENGVKPIMTQPYAAPELLLDLAEEDSALMYNESVDYWALGATLVALLMDEVSDRS